MRLEFNVVNRMLIAAHGFSFIGGIILESVKTSVQIPIDINGRYSHKIVYTMQPLRSCVYITHNGRTVNAKSILGILSLHLKSKDIIDINCYNDDINVAETDIIMVEKYLSNIDREE